MSDLAAEAQGSTRPRPADGPPPRGAGRRHSLIVKVMRIVLPALMIGVIALLAGLVAAHAIRRQAAARHEAQAPIRMLNPHFYGRDSKGRAYVLGASEAMRDERSLELVLLKNPKVTMDMDGPRPSTLTADTGTYHEDTRILRLKGHVRASDQKASNFATDVAVINTQTGEVMGPTALASRTSVGDLQSGGFNVYDKGAKVIFKGGVHARLQSR